MHDVGPGGEVLAGNVFDIAQGAFAIEVVVGDVEGCGAGGVDVVGGADEGVAYGAEVGGGGGADRVAEDLNLGAGFGGRGRRGGGIVVGRIREVVDRKDVDCVGGGWRGVDVDAVGDERTGEALEGEPRGGEGL